MLRKLTSFLRPKPEEQATVRLESLHRWTLNQLKPDIRIQESMLKTVCDDFPQMHKGLEKAVLDFDKTRLRTEDFPSAPPQVTRTKSDFVSLAKEAVRDIEVVINQGKGTLDDHKNTFETLSEIHKKLKSGLSSGNTLRRYFPMHAKQIEAALHDFDKVLKNMNDVLTSPLLARVDEVTTHIEQITTKEQKRSELKVHLNKYQQQINEKYREYLKFEAKINDIKESKRFKLEHTHPKGKRSSPIGHFSVLEQEIKELQNRKKHLGDSLKQLKGNYDQLMKQYKANATEAHVKRIEEILHDLTKIHVEVVHEPV